MPQLVVSNVCNQHYYERCYAPLTPALATNIHKMLTFGKPSSFFASSLSKKKTHLAPKQSQFFIYFFQTHFLFYQIIQIYFTIPIFFARL